MVSAFTCPSPLALTRCAPPAVPNTAGSRVLWNTLMMLAANGAEDRRKTRTEASLRFIDTELNCPHILNFTNCFINS